uniref:Secreted protein n=1 Tax=Panagrolaimus superbus TaxID=310955 RepID=A0A914YDL2_9BILA
MRILSLITFCSLASFALASYCGQSAIPFSFEALSNGQPILGCARPSCFGWNADGKRSADSAQFYRIGKQSDGFLRTTDSQGPIVKNATYFRPQFSVSFKFRTRKI